MLTKGATLDLVVALFVRYWFVEPFTMSCLQLVWLSTFIRFTTSGLRSMGSQKSMRWDPGLQEPSCVVGGAKMYAKDSVTRLKMGSVLRVVSPKLREF